MELMFINLKFWFLQLWSSCQKKGHNFLLVILIEAILDFLESLRNSLQFAYKICLQEVCEEEEKCILIFGSDANFWKILHTGILDQSHCKDDNFLLVNRI